MTIFNVVDYGSVGDGQTDVSKSFQKAIAAANEVGGGTVYVPSGVFRTTSIRLESNITLEVSPGATISFVTEQEAYPVVHSRWEGWTQDVYQSCIYAENVENIKICGGGVIDGNGAEWWDLFRNRREELKYPRPKLISFEKSNRITIQDVQLRNSPAWTINPILSHNITVDNVSILNPADSPNTDGIDPESCSNVRISNCNIDVGDDCIAIKSGTEDAAEKVACENITITNCTMIHGHGGVVLGSEMSGDIRNVVISNCIFKQTDRGIRLKTRRGRGGTIEDIRIDNIVMDEVICPFILNLYYFCGPRGKEKYVWDKNPYPVTEETPTFRRIHFNHITARNVQGAAGFIYGLAENYIKEITFNNIDISMAENAEPGQVAMMTGLDYMNNRGFYIGNGEDILFNHVSVENHEGPMIYLENCRNIQTENCVSKNTEQVEKLIEEKVVHFS